MSSPAQRTNSRLKLFQLLAMAFSHPTSEFHGRILDGSFAEITGACYKNLFGQQTVTLNFDLPFVDFEAQYIELFATGQKGRPAVGLHAGDHGELLDGQSRPKFMLDYVSWYKHFGVKPRVEPGESELPDHLTCQLEFMALLAHLEFCAEPESPACLGYQAAQRDFLERHLFPFCELITLMLTRETEVRETHQFFVHISKLTHDLCQSSLHEFRSCLHQLAVTNQTQGNGNPDVREVDLWT